MPIRKSYRSSRPRQEFDEEAPPGPSDEEEDDRRGGPIGVPEDYPIPGGVVPREFHPGVSSGVATFGTEEMRERYMDGDEFLPANFSADRIVQMQLNLEQIGLLNRGAYSLGIWDPATMNAYKDLLGLANAQGSTAEDTLNQYLAIVEAGGGPISDASTAGIQPLVITTTPAEELAPVFRRAAIELTGRGWDQSQIDQAISIFNSIESQRQTEAYNAQLSPEGSTVSQIPSPEAFIQSHIQATEPEEVESESALTFINEFMDIAANGTGWNM